MIDLMSMSKAADTSEIGGNFKGDSKRGRPVATLERKQDLMMLSSIEKKRLSALRHDLEDCGYKVSKSEVVGIGIFLASELSAGELSEILTKVKLGE